MDESTRWTVEEQDDVDAGGNGYRWAIKVNAAGYVQNPAYANSEKNADHIARCVNAFAPGGEVARLVEAERELEEIKGRRAEQESLCDAGLCDHYTCTEGRAIEEWERNNPDYEADRPVSDNRP
jgi:hypothetical protein